MKKIHLIFLISLFSLSCFADIDIKKLAAADSLINLAIKEKLIPGGVLCIVHKGETVYLKAYGNKSILPKEQKTEINTIFDLASVTKPFTAMAVMQMIESGKIRLEESASLYLDWLPKNIKIINLMTHTSGIADYKYPEISLLLKQQGKGNKQALQKYILSKQTTNPPSENFEYSCLNYVLLQYIVEKVSGDSLDKYMEKNIFKPLGMNSTCYNPKQTLLERVAPTELLSDGKLIEGEVHDSLALHYLGGVAGNAGLFSSAEDMAILCKTLLGKGTYKDRQIMGKLTYNTMVSIPQSLEKFGRSLGWDNCSAYSSDHGNLFSYPQTYGHTGYTGPSILIDPVNETALVFLAHRVHPANVGSMVAFRTKLANIVAGAIN